MVDAIAEGSTLIHRVPVSQWSSPMVHVRRINSVRMLAIGRRGHGRCRTTTSSRVAYFLPHVHDKTLSSGAPSLLVQK